MAWQVCIQFMPAIYWYITILNSLYIITYLYLPLYFHTIFQGHIVHYNTKYGTIEEALNHADGLCVLGVFLKVIYENPYSDITLIGFAI